MEITDAQMREALYRVLEGEVADDQQFRQKIVAELRRMEPEMVTLTDGAGVKVEITTEQKEYLKQYREHKVPAIQALRECAGCGLKEAKRVIDRYWTEAWGLQYDW